MAERSGICANVESALLRPRASLRNFGRAPEDSSLRVDLLRRASVCTRNTLITRDYVNKQFLSTYFYTRVDACKHARGLDVDSRKQHGEQGGGREGGGREGRGEKPHNVAV